MPTDTTPDPRDMARLPEAQQIPQAKGGTARVEAADIARRPALPQKPETMAADIEDEEDDPVVDSGPGIADRMPPGRRG